jgi:hypothetical protein
MQYLRGASGSMHRDSADRLNLPPGWHRDVHNPARLIGKFLQLRGRLVTQHRGRSGAENHGPELGIPAEFAGERGVDAAVHSLPSTRPDPGSQQFRIQARLNRLTRGDEAGLEPD